MKKVEIALVIIMSLGFAITVVASSALLLGTPENIENMKMSVIVGVLIFFAAISAIAKIDLLRNFLTN